jgi:predicted RNase H-like HicB family nuclease
MTRLDNLLALPWTIQRHDETYEAERSIELSVKELPGFTVCGDSEDEAEAAFWPALRVFLESYMEDGETPPLPELVRRVAAENRRGLVATPEADIDALLGINLHRLGHTVTAEMGGGPVTGL